MKNISIAVLSIIVLLMGCVTSHQTIHPDIRIVKSPLENVVTTSSLGDRMLESGTVTVVDGFVLHNDVAIFDGIVKSGEFHQIGIKENHKVFARKGGRSTGIVTYSGSPSPAKPYIDGDSGKLCFFGGLGTRFCSDNVKPRVAKFNMYTPDSFMQELIYTGKVGEKIRFTYREYQNGMARQAFNVNVEYDLKESSVISYKNASIEVISATNQKIEYKVLKHFN